MCDEEEEWRCKRLEGPPIVASEEEDEVVDSEVEKDVEVEAKRPRVRGWRGCEGDMGFDGWGWAVEDGAASETREDHWALSDSRDDSCCWSSV